MLDLSDLSTMVANKKVEIEFHPAPLEHTSLFKCPDIAKVIETAPEVVKTLVAAGFYLHGSRSKLPADIVGTDADWDLTFPVLDLGVHSTENHRILKELGFSLAVDDQDMYDGSEMVQCPNFREYWVHESEHVTAIRRKDERLFRQAWDSIGPYAFEQFVWKRAYHNRNTDVDEIQHKRHMFMLTLYSTILGRDVIWGLTHN